MECGEDARASWSADQPYPPAFPAEYSPIELDTQGPEGPYILCCDCSQVLCEDRLAVGPFPCSPEVNLCASFSPISNSPLRCFCCAERDAAWVRPPSPLCLAPPAWHCGNPNTPALSSRRAVLA